MVSNRPRGLTEGYIEQARAKNTLRAYKTDWLCFGEWCIRHNQVGLPASPATVANYLTWLADQGYRPATVRRRMAAISQGHQLMDRPTPVKSGLVKLTWQGIKRAKGIAQVGKAPALVGDVRRMVARCRITCSECANVRCCSGLCGGISPIGARRLERRGRGRGRGRAADLGKKEQD